MNKTKEIVEGVIIESFNNISLDNNTIKILVEFIKELNAANLNTFLTDLTLDHLIGITSDTAAKQDVVLDFCYEIALRLNLIDSKILSNISLAIADVYDNIPNSIVITKDLKQMLMYKRDIKRDKLLNVYILIKIYGIRKIVDIINKGM